MRIGFIVNDVKSEEGVFTTSRLGQAAVNRGHEVLDNRRGRRGLRSRTTRSAPGRRPCRNRSTAVPTSYTVPTCRGKMAVKRRVTVDELDVLILRNVPSDDYLQRVPGPATAATEFARVAMRHGVIVLSDPNGSGEGGKQDVLPTLPGRGPPSHTHHSRP